MRVLEQKEESQELVTSLQTIVEPQTSIVSKNKSAAMLKAEEKHPILAAVEPPLLESLSIESKQTAKSKTERISVKNPIFAAKSLPVASKNVVKKAKPGDVILLAKPMFFVGGIHAKRVKSGAMAYASGKPHSSSDITDKQLSFRMRQKKYL